MQIWKLVHHHCSSDNHNTTWQTYQRPISTLNVKILRYRWISNHCRFLYLRVWDYHNFLSQWFYWWSEHFSVMVLLTSSNKLVQFVWQVIDRIPITERNHQNRIGVWINLFLKKRKWLQSWNINKKLLRNSLILLYTVCCSILSFPSHVRKMKTKSSLR